MEYSWLRVSLVAQTVKNLPFLGRKPRLVNSVVLISCVQQSDSVIYIYIYIYIYTHTHNTFLSFFLSFFDSTLHHVGY